MYILVCPSSVISVDPHMIMTILVGKLRTMTIGTPCVDNMKPVDVPSSWYLKVDGLEKRRGTVGRFITSHEVGYPWWFLSFQLLEKRSFHCLPLPSSTFHSIIPQQDSIARRPKSRRLREPKPRKPGLITQLRHPSDSQ